MSTIGCGRFAADVTEIGLEARYRRLLRCYPADHQAVHRDEMLGVLMNAAEPGRDRPGLRESADLLAGAVLIRLRPGRALSDRNGWRDTLAIYSVAAPVFMLSSAVLGWLAGLTWSYLGHTAGLSVSLGVGNGAFENLQDAHPVLATLLWLVLAGQAIVAVLALAGRRRGAAVAAALYVVYFGTYVVIPVTYAGPFLGLSLSMPVLFAAPLTTLVALLASAGPRRGLQLMQRRHWACLAAGSVVGAAVIQRLNVGVLFTQSVAPWLFQLLAGAVMAAVVLALAAAWLGSAGSKRMAIVFGVLAIPALLQLAESYGQSSLTAANVVVPVAEALVLCLLGMIVYRTRRGARPAGGGPA
jgi:hypothetical protein